MKFSDWQSVITQPREWLPIQQLFSTGPASSPSASAPVEAPAPDEPSPHGELIQALESLLAPSTMETMDESSRRQLKADLLASWADAVRSGSGSAPGSVTEAEGASPFGRSAWPVVAGVPVLLGIAAWVWHRYAQRPQQPV